MTSIPKKLDFHNDSRKPFAEEAPVIDAVERARKQVGVVQGSALFNGSSYVSATPTVIPRALDIIRNGMGTALERAIAEGYAQGFAEGLGQSVLEMAFEKPKHLGTTQASQDILASLRRLGFAKEPI